MKNKEIAILASGSGTNAENIIRFFDSKPGFRVSKLMSNKKDAFALTRAARHDIPSMYFSREEFMDSSFLSHFKNIDLIVLAGFLWLVPSYLVDAFPNRIINIHPALLPKYGGKGMYGHHVHKAVIDNGEKESGISIHYVNEKYDEGNIIFQAKCPVLADDTPEDLASRVHNLEYEYFPRVIQKILEDL